MPAEAPAAPPPTPAAPTAPAAAPSAPAKPFNAVLDNPAIEEHFKSYDKPKEAKAAPKPEAKTPEAKAEPKAGKSPEPEKGEAKEAPKADDKAAPAPEPEHKNIKELRTAYETTKKAAQAHEAKIKELEARIAESTKTAPVADEKVWQEKVSAKDKEAAELRQKLAEQDFTQSAEYQEKYWNPYVNSYKRGIQSLMGLKGQNADGTPREISQQDAEFLLSLPEAKGLEIAQQLFGDNIAALTILTTHKNRIAESMENLAQGKASFQKIAEERRNREFQERQSLDEARSKLWVKENQAFTESSPWFKEDENDPEGTEALKKGYAEIDRVFSPEFNQGKIEDIVKAHVALRHKAAVYDRMDAEVKKLREKVSALEKERAELMDSAPTTDGGSSKAPESDADKRPSELLDSIKWGRR